MFAAKVVVLEPNLTKSVETDIGFCFLKKYVAKIYLRSSLSLCFIHIGGEIIDPDFRGNLCVIMSNFSSNKIHFNVRDRIEQVLWKKEHPDFIEVANFDDFFTKGGDKGFGSTGI